MTQHQQTLSPPQHEAKWSQHGQPFGLTAFETKAFYVIGAFREMIESAGLSLKREYFLAAMLTGLTATELLGRCISPPTLPTDRLHAGLDHLFPGAPSAVKDYVGLRNFLGHGSAAATPGVKFSEMTSIDLLLALTSALDEIWTERDQMAHFAGCEIDPITTRNKLIGTVEIIYVRKIMGHLDRGRRPSQGMRWADWRQQARFSSIMLNNSSPAASGTA